MRTYVNVGTFMPDYHPLIAMTTSTKLQEATIDLKQNLKSDKASFNIVSNETSRIEIIPPFKEIEFTHINHIWFFDASR